MDLLIRVKACFLDGRGYAYRRGLKKLCRLSVSANVYSKYIGTESVPYATASTERASPRRESGIGTAGAGALYLRQRERNRPGTGSGGDQAQRGGLREAEGRGPGDRAPRREDRRRYPESFV